MKWFRKRKRTELDVKVIEVSMAGLARQILHDGVFGEEEKVAAMLGLPPQSEEVNDMEYEASENRIAAVHIFMPLLEAHAQIMGEIGIAAYKVSLGDPELDEEELQTLNELGALLRLVSFSSSLSALSMLIDMGLVLPEADTHE